MKIYKAILTGGGRATRLHPVTTTINKHLLPLANKPMIFHAIEKVVEAGVTEIYINLNPGETELQKHVGDGGHWGVKIEYFEQTGGPQGIAHVVKEAERFIGNDPFMFYLSDNILFGSVKDMVDEFSAGAHDCMLALSEVPDPNRFGVPVFDTNGRLVDVLEKPVDPPSRFAVTGIYLYGPRVFFEAFSHIEKSPRGEYEISSIHSDLLKRGLSVGHKEITGWWKDTGQSHDLLLANKLLLDNMNEQEFLHDGMVEQGARIFGKVHIGKGSTVGSGVQIVGPVIIGQNCSLRECSVGPYVTIGTGTEVVDATIENSIVLENAIISTPIKITDSIIGKMVRLVRRDVNGSGGHKMIIGDKTVIEF